MKHFLVRTILKLMRYFGQILEILHLKVFIPPNIAHRIANKLHIELVDDPNTLYKFWRQEKPKGNYFGTPEWSARSQTIITILSPWVKKENSILEVGCNVGRNLNHLWNAGYKNLNGIEISEIAVARGLKAYPHLSEISMHLGPADFMPLCCLDVYLRHYTGRGGGLASRLCAAHACHRVRSGILAIRLKCRVSGCDVHRSIPDAIMVVSDPRGLSEQPGSGTVAIGLRPQPDGGCRRRISVGASRNG